MPRFPCDWVDAFSDRAFGGNGCAVVHGGALLPAAVACAFVRETSLVECTFTGPSDVADVRVRYFLAGGEIPFAGHPTIATVAAMRDRGLVTKDHITLETGAGLIAVSVRGDMIEMTQIAPEFGDFVAPDLIAAVMSLPSDAIISPPQVVSTGLPFVITVVRDRGDVQAARLNMAAFENQFAGQFHLGDAPVMEPFIVARDGATPAGDTFARLLLPPPNPLEDPFTGSATGAMAAYLWRHGLMQKDQFVAQQGHDMGRPGQAVVTRHGSADKMTGIGVAGTGFVLMRGEVDLPHTL
jgi:PhzF family phenazine biosynthesis protein